MLLPFISLWYKCWAYVRLIIVVWLFHLYYLLCLTIICLLTPKARIFLLLDFHLSLKVLNYPHLRMLAISESTESPKAKPSTQYIAEMVSNIESISWILYLLFFFQNHLIICQVCDDLITIWDDAGLKVIHRKSIIYKVFNYWEKRNDKSRRSISLKPKQHGLK